MNDKQPLRVYFGGILDALGCSGCPTNTKNDTISLGFIGSQPNAQFKGKRRPFMHPYQNKIQIYYSTKKSSVEGPQRRQRAASKTPTPPNNHSRQLPKSTKSHNHKCENVVFTLGFISPKPLGQVQTCAKSPRMIRHASTKKKLL